MSNYIGYKPEDNARRKSNNLTDQLPIGPNQNVKSYSTTPGQLSRTAQVQKEHNHYQKLNKKQPVRKIDDPSIIQAYEQKYCRKSA